MKAICQALIILLILQSVKGRKGQKITKNSSFNPKKVQNIFLDEKSPTNCFVCRLVLDLVMQGLDTNAGKDEVQIISRTIFGAAYQTKRLNTKLYVK